MIPGLLGFAVVFTLIGLGMPIAFAMGIVGVVGLALTSGLSMAQFQAASITYAMSAQYVFAVVPLFLLMGQLAADAGLTGDLYQAARRWLGNLRGGLALTTIAAGAAFGACSGSSTAAAALFSRVSLPEMEKHGYDKSLAAGCVAATGTLAVMIPPSIAMVLYGIITGQSIGALLIAGIIPGVVTALAYAVTVHILVRRNPRLAPRTFTPATPREKLSSLKLTWPAMLLFLLVLGGIYLGWFTPTAAAAIGAFGAFVLLVARKRLSRAGLMQSLKETGATVSMVFLIIIMGMIFSRFLVVTGFVDWLARSVTEAAVPPLVIIGLIIVIYIILGCLMDTTSMLIITLPILTPVVLNLGYSGVWFGILVVALAELAVLTPPIGLNCFVVAAASEGRVSLTEVFRGVLPFAIAELGVIVLLIAFPQLALWLPSMMMK